jgi:thiamine pyrophosphate-dependent acetolactate synthase large subunit-like protein
MAKTTGDVIVEKLLDWGVDTIFGLPGDGINGIFESLRKNKPKIRFIQVRHKEAAAFASRKPAVVEAVVDPYEPPMPASATPEQALHFAESLVRGEPDAGKILGTVFKDQIRALV